MKEKDKRTYADRRDYLIDAVSKRRKSVRLKAINHKGGKCELCGYHRCKDALEFHHLEESSKRFGVSSKGYTRSWEKVKQELDKCILVCANCHRELHAGIAAFPSNRD
jgi:predicted HNH restriction endonuclease